jgi:hypothetical protein
MKRLFPSAILLLAFASGSILPAAETKAAAPAAKPAAKSTVAGDYTGTWTGKDQATGSLSIKLKQDASATWVAEAMFTFQGNEVPTKTKELVVNGSKLELTISWQAEGTAAQTTLTGALSGNVLEGTFGSTISESTASGTWRVTRS